MHKVLLRKLCVLAALMLPLLGVLVLGTVRAQGPGGFSGVPSPPFGPPSGFSGGSGIPRPPSPFGPSGPGGGIPEIPRPPDFGRPGGIPSRPRDPFDGGRLSPFEYVFTCSNCGKELGRSDRPFDKPPYNNCPHCGVRFINGGRGFSGPGSTFKPSDGAGQQSPPSGGFTPPNFGSGLGSDGSSSRLPFGSLVGEDDGFNNAAAVTTGPLEGGMSAFWLIMALIGGIVGLLVIAGGVTMIVLVARGGSAPAKRRVRRVRDEDDFEPAPAVPRRGSRPGRF